MAPIVHGLEAEYHDRIHFVYLDIDDPANDAYKQQLGYRYQPHILLLDGEGTIVQQWLGPVSEDDLRTALQSQVPQ
jgi:thioredoxin-like negative regulator of GroEL